MSTQSTRQQDGYNKPPRSSSSNSISNSNPDPPTFLKIPRIRLKQKSQQKSPSSPGSPPQQSPTDPKNNKFSYIENSHLVNPIMIQQQQQKMRSSRKEEIHHYSDGDEEEILKPKKLPNPVQNCAQMQSIHRELLLNKKIGRSVLTHKTELQKALEKLATKNVDSDNNTTSDPNHDKHSNSGPNPPPSLPPPSSVVVAHNNKNEFQRILDARAKQIEDQKCFVDGVTKRPVIRESEFEKIHKKITNTQK